MSVTLICPLCYFLFFLFFICKLNTVIHVCFLYTGACTNHIENEWLHVRKGLPAYVARHAHINSYLGEHLWRTKVKAEVKDPFLEFLHAASEVYDVDNPPITLST